MTDTEELIVAALRAQAENRPDGTAVRAALRRTGGQRRGRRLVVIVAAVTAIAITVPLVLRGAQSPPPATATSRPQPPPPPNQPAFWRQAMAYEPGWLPDGIVERSRMGAAKGVMRRWDVPPGADWPGPDVMLEFYPMAFTHSDDDDRIDVHGVPAFVTSRNSMTDGETTVEWQLEPGLYLHVTVHGGLQHRDFAIRIANSVHKGGPGQLRPLVDFDWCPYDKVGLLTDGSDPSHVGGSFRCTGTGQRPGETNVTINPQPDNQLVGGTKVIVRGREGRYFPARQSIQVELDNGSYLVVRSHLSKAELIKITDTLVIHDAAYVNWVGTR